MEAQILDHLLEGLVLTSIGLLTFLVRSYFSRIQKDIADVRSSVDRFEGRFSSIADEMHRATVEMAVTRQEMKAVWKVLDGANRRSSDANGHL